MNQMRRYNQEYKYGHSCIREGGSDSIGQKEFQLNLDFPLVMCWEFSVLVGSDVDFGRTVRCRRVCVSAGGESPLCLDHRQPEGSSPTAKMDVLKKHAQYSGVVPDICNSLLQDLFGESGHILLFGLLFFNAWESIL